VRPVKTFLVELENRGEKPRERQWCRGPAFAGGWRRLARRFPRCLDGREDRGRRSARADRDPQWSKEFRWVARAELARTHGVMSAARFADKITVDVSQLNIGDSIHVRDIKLPDAVAAKVQPELTVFSVTAPTVEEEPVVPEAEAAAAGPEVIKEKKEEAKVPRQRRVRPQLQPRKRNRRSNLLGHAQRWRTHAFGWSLDWEIQVRIMPALVTTSALPPRFLCTDRQGRLRAAIKVGRHGDESRRRNLDEAAHVHESKRKRACRCGRFLQDRLSWDSGGAG